MPRLPGLLLASLLLIAPVRPGQAAPADAIDGSIFQLRIASPVGVTDATSVLVGREDRGADAVLYLLTSTRPFKTPDGELRRPLGTVRVVLDGGRAVDVRRDDLFLPGGSIPEVAIVRVVARRADAVPRPIVYDPPPVGAVFLVSGYDRDGAAATVGERVRFESTRLAIGDRGLSTLVGCVGAPAIAPQGVFGVVTECDADRPPVIALLSLARAFIERHVPRSKIETSPAPLFQIADRSVAGPLMLVGCDATKSGELDVPLDLGPKVWAIDAEAEFTNRREVGLAEVTVLKVGDRAVRLRFTLGGLPSPPAPPTTCPQGQALVTVRVNVAVGRTPD